jgi:Flp pilus assembly protein TadD
LQIAGLNADLDPHHADTWNNLGILLADADDPAGACDAFREALELDPEDPKAHYNLADVLDTLGYPDQARPHWRAYLRHDPAGSPWADHARERLRGTG